MKCIKSNETGEIKRVSEDSAVYQVGSGKWSFAPKQEWKKLRAPVKAAAPVIEAEESVAPPRPKKPAKKK